MGRHSACRALPLPSMSRVKRIFLQRDAQSKRESVAASEGAGHAVTLTSPPSFLPSATRPITITPTSASASPQSPQPLPHPDMPASTVYIARHGERIDHVDPEWKASADNPYDPFLTTTGLAQARALGRHLKSRNLSHIFASPFYRTVQTAVQVAHETGVPVSIEPGLAEFQNANWFDHQPELRTAAALAAEFPRVDPDYRPVLPRTWFPESRDDVIVRCGWTARALAGKFDGNILLVGHGITCEFTARGITTEGIRPYISYCSLQTCALEDASSLKYRVEGADEADVSFMADDIKPKVRTG